MEEGRKLWGKDEYMPSDRFDFWGGWAGQTPPGGYHPTEPRYEGKHLTEWCGDQAVKFLRSQRKDRPFCLSISFFSPKGSGLQSSDAKPEYLELFQDAEFPYPPAYVDGDNTRLPTHLQRFWRGPNVHQRETVPRVYQTFMRRRSALLYGMDAEIGKIRKELERLGLADNTAIIFTSGNGYMHGAHGLGGEAILYEDSIHAPLVVYDPRAPANLRGRRMDGLVSTVDYAATMLDLAGGSIPGTMQGVSFKPMIEGSKQAVREDVYCEHNFTDYVIPGLEQVRGDWQRNVIHDTSIRCRAVRTEAWKYIVFHERRPQYEEFYSLENDPTEQNNLAHDPNHSEIFNSLGARCQQYYDQATASVKTPNRPSAAADGLD